MVTRLLASSRTGARPVFKSPSVKVLNCVGTMLKRASEAGGGRRMESMPWIRPLEAPYCCYCHSSLDHSSEYTSGTKRRETYNINRDHATIEIDLQSAQPGTDSQSLRQVIPGHVLLQQRRDGPMMEHVQRRKHSIHKMISQRRTESLLRRLGKMLGQLGEGVVRRREEREVGMVRISVVEQLDQRVVLVDDLGQTCGVFAGGEEMVDGFVGGVAQVRWEGEMGDWEGEFALGILYFIIIIFVVFIFFCLSTAVCLCRPVIESMTGIAHQPVNPRLDIEPALGRIFRGQVCQRIKRYVQWVRDISALFSFFLDGIFRVLFIVVLSNSLEHLLGWNDKGRAEGYQREEEQKSHGDNIDSYILLAFTRT